MPKRMGSQTVEKVVRTAASAVPNSALTFQKFNIHLHEAI